LKGVARCTQRFCWCTQHSLKWQNWPCLFSPFKSCVFFLKKSEQPVLCTLLLTSLFGAIFSSVPWQRLGSMKVKVAVFSIAVVVGGGIQGMHYCCLCVQVYGWSCGSSWSVKHHTAKRQLRRTREEEAEQSSTTAPPPRRQQWWRSNPRHRHQQSTRGRGITQKKKKSGHGRRKRKRHGRRRRRNGWVLGVEFLNKFGKGIKVFST